ncbi:tetratricopeptide repeat protein [Porticoccus sp. W117]|uniref:tetratricopeptide repeat protein n=1 Tax=Porticoccus sp. W117 TaxID=3054777 RepID=UPI002592F40F|nr:tetratricopeptide repeat protein [Porticoccus sp. W117]MDM3870737.1 tetratricopeptide repeat protein [Porticoccus sp. W117]
MNAFRKLLPLTLLCCTALSHGAATGDAIEQYQEAIDELEAHYGAYDIGLAEPLRGLGEALQANGEHQDAIDIFKRGLHVRRVNDGISSISQEPLLRLLNSSYQAVGNVGAVATNYQRQLDLYRSHHGNSSPKLLPLQLEAARWHRGQYIQTRNKEAFAHLTEAIRLITNASAIDSQQKDSLTIERLNSEIENHYYLIDHFQRFAPRPPADYVRFQSRNFRPRYRDESRFEYQIAYDNHLRRETARLTKRYQREQIDSAVSKALATYNRLSRLHQSNQEPLLQANSLVQQGDWLILFGNSPQQAHSLYRKSWQLLTDNNQLEERTSLFGEPHLLPVFDTPDPANFTTIAKVKMDIDLNGKARNITVLETQPDEKSVARKAQRQLRDARFRSRLDNGEPTTSEGYELSLLID